MSTILSPSEQIKLISLNRQEQVNKQPKMIIKTYSLFEVAHSTAYLQNGVQ